MRLSNAQDLASLKKFAQDSSAIVANYGVSKACVNFYLLKGVTTMIDCINPPDGKRLVKIEFRDALIEM